MNKLLLSSILAMSAITIAGAQTVIPSQHGHGVVSWTNAVNTNAYYRVEWQAAAGGTWFRSLQNLQTLDAHAATSFVAKVPMRFRVVRETRPPPAGMVWIEAGDFVQGQAGIATPVHTNFVSGFWMDDKEITLAEWREVYTWATNNGYQFDNPGTGFTNNHPVGNINWYDAVKWCNARSEREGLKACYYTNVVKDAGMEYRQGQLNISNAWVNWDADGYRLPTEAEWEKAARGGRQGRLFPWGDTITHAQANYFSTNLHPYDVSPTRGMHPAFFGQMPNTAPTVYFAANEFGLFHMAGNVAEWTWNWSVPYTGAGEQNPLGSPTGSLRVTRGGQAVTQADQLRCAARSPSGPSGLWPYVGFRCVTRR